MPASYIFPITYISTCLLGAFLLPLLRRLKFGQTVRTEGPKAHYAKNGTPTMGGFFFLIPFIALTTYFVIVNRDWDLLALLLLVIWMGAIGFLDDFTKVRKHKGGLSAKQKTVPMLLGLVLFVAYLVWRGPVQLYIPFVKGALTLSGLWLWLYLPLLLIFLYFTINAINLTDGVDGLLSSVTVAALIGLLVLFKNLMPTLLSEGVERSLTTLGIALIAFMTYNRHPAQVFMGDLGSLSIGAFYAGLLALLGMPWLLLLNGFIYLAEAMSVVIQVLYFKKTGGRRIFRMSPIHHHYELGGWSEWKIVIVFVVVTLLASVLAGFLVWTLV